ncbi:MAG: peptide chain release factor N(5)-glutamine methyltransferase [Xanthobacteraceae bacterium]
MIDDIAPGITVAAARRRLAEAFRRAGLDTPELDARVLVGHALGVDEAALLAMPDRRLSRQQAADIAALAARRLARAPVARLVGAKEFWGLKFRLNAATLVPRPESETVVETALAALDNGGSRLRPLKIADLGTGSGALLVALLSELPNATGVGTDVSLSALTAARDNAVHLGCGDRAAFVACDVGAALAGGFDVVVCNPPYVRSGDIAGLTPEVRDHDPAAALDGGPDALSFYRALSRDADRLIGPCGRLVVELGAGAADDVAHVFSAAGLVAAPARSDLAGIARALVLAHPECV